MTNNQKILRIIFIIAGLINILLLLFGLATAFKAFSMLTKFSGRAGGFGFTLIPIFLGLFQQIALTCLFFWAADRIKPFKE